jgi:hypothetical protein
MSVSSELYKVNVVGDGSTPSIAFNRKVFNSTDIKGFSYDTTTNVETALINGTDFTVTGAGDTSSGVTITPASSIATGTNWVLYSDAGNAQGTTLTTAGEFPAKSLEYAFDKLAIGTQEADGKADRALKLPVSDTASADLPNKTDRASKVLGFDASGNPTAYAQGTSTNSDAVNYDQGGTGSVATTVEAKFQEVVSVKDFGATGDGATDDTAAITAAWAYVKSLAGSGGDQYPSSSQVALYFPSGHYLSSSGLVLDTGFYTGISVIGDGKTSQLDKIDLLIEGWRGTVRGLFFRGISAYGIKRVSNDGILSGTGRFYTIEDIHIRDKTTAGLWIDGGTQDNLTNLLCEKNTVGILMDSTNGTMLTNVICQNNTQDGILVNSGGELKLCNVMTLSNATSDSAGIYANLRVEGLAAAANVEHYFTQVTATINSGTRDYSISASHQLVEGELNATISGTTSYDGTYTVTDVLSNTTFNVTAAYVASETGSLSLPGWDVIINTDGINYDTNDIYFIGGNINRLYIKDGYNIHFIGTRLKQQKEFENVNRVFISGGARGRLSGGFEDVPVTGTNTGWAEMSYRDDSGAAAAGNGYASISVPSNGTALSANRQATLNEVNIKEDTVDIVSEGLTSSFAAKGLDSGAYGSGSSTAISDDAAYSFTPPVSNGVIMLRNNNSQSARGCIASFDTASPFVAVYGYQGSVIEFGTGVYTGTDGTDTKITVSAHTDGKIYLENRSGGAQTLHWTILA